MYWGGGDYPHFFKSLYQSLSDSLAPISSDTVAGFPSWMFSNYSLIKTELCVISNKSKLYIYIIGWLYKSDVKSI